MPNIYWNEEKKYWRCQVTIDGKRKSIKSYKAGNAGKREVKLKVDAYLSGADSTRRTVAQEWSYFLDDVKARSSMSNHRNLEQLGRLYILPQIGSKQIVQVKITDLQKVINNSTKQDGSMLSNKMYRNIKGAITNFMRFARMDSATDIVTTDLYVPRNASKGSKNVLDIEQVKRIFNEFDDEFYINLWRLMLCTGMRPSEALGLKWENVQGNSLNIVRGVNYQHEITDCKNDNARRAIPINSLIRDILENQKERTAYLNSEWIFPSPSGDMPYQSTTQHSIKRISDALGVDICAYGLRHTFISIMKNNLSEAYIAQIVGHSPSFKTYSSTYVHPINGEKEQASIIIDDTLRKMI